MNIGKAFNFTFEDDQWLSKSVIGAIVTAIPIVNFAWGGYLIELLNNVINDEPEPLPAWSDFGDKWVTGFMVFLASLIYAIPALILACIPMVFLGGMAALSGEGNLADSMLGLFAGVGGLFACLIAIYSLALTFYYPAIYIHYARIGNFGAFFEFGNINKIITKDTGKYLTAWGVSILAGFVVGLVGVVIAAILSIIPCLGQIVAWLVMAFISVYIFYIYGHLFGQVAAAPAASTAMTVPPPPPPSDLTEE